MEIVLMQFSQHVRNSKEKVCKNVKLVQMFALPSNALKYQENKSIISLNCIYTYPVFV